MFTMFAFLNCMYFKYCFMFCFDYTTENIKPAYFRFLFFCVALFSVLYIAVGIFNEWRFSQLTKGKYYVLCQVLSPNVYQMIKGVDVTKLGNKDWDPFINWNGMVNLNETYVNYVNSYLIPLKNRIAQSEFFTAVDYTFNETRSLYNGLNLLNEYIQNSSFAFSDTNSKYNIKFNSTYVCQKCKQLINNLNESCI